MLNLKASALFAGLMIYLSVLVNQYMFIGILMGIAARTATGKSISVVTGIVIGMLIAEAVKFVLYKT